MLYCTCTKKQHRDKKEVPKVIYIENNQLDTLRRAIGEMDAQQFERFLAGVLALAINASLDKKDKEKKKEKGEE